MLNNTKRLLAFMLVCVMIFALAGCGGNGDTTSIVYEEQIEYVDGSGSGDSTASGDKTGTTSKKDDTSKKDNTSSTSDPDNDEVNPEDYRGKTVKFAVTIMPDNDESGPVVKKFQEEYGITIKCIQSDQGNYANQLNGWIAAGDSPDVARSNGDFPNCMSYLQSLDASKIDYDDEIWNDKTFELTTFGGSPYLCDTVGNIWSEIDIVAYSKSQLKRANLYTPEEYDKAGKWTWDTYFEICRAVKNTCGNLGGAFLSYENAVHGMGGAIFRLKDGKMVNGIDDTTQNAFVKYTTARKEGIIDNTGSIDYLASGKVGITTCHAWSTKKTGDLKSANWSDIGFYYMPRVTADSDYATVGMLRGWGICKGAKEPVAAGIFLRYYLDVNNYDVDNTFISAEAENFFFAVTSIDYSDWNPYFTYCAYNEEAAGLDYSDIWNSGLGADPTQVPSKMTSIKDMVAKGAKNLNAYIEKNVNAN